MRRIVCLLLLCVLTWMVASAARAAEVAVPDPLEAWRGWALDGENYRECALIAGRTAQGGSNDFRCSWPGVLRIDADATGAQFAVRVQVQAESWVPLPGDGQVWPQGVRVDGQPRPVVAHEGRPQLRLAAGQYLIDGHFEWERRPQSLAVPADFGLVRLQVDGSEIVPVQHEGEALVLGRGASEAPEADALTLRVYRRLEDGVPATLETHLQIGASGQAREEVFGPILPPGFVPTALSVDAGWPARLEPDGRLRVQVQPASTVIRIFARATAPLTQVAAVKIPEPWPVQEVWSYQSNPAQRITNATGPAQVDPVQAGVPGEWQALPAFAMAAGDVLAVELRSRGLGSDQANRLQLQREAWLDFSGAGWTFHDLITGQMRQGWRLDALPPYKLEQARDLNDDAPLLVTQGDGGATGVEWRTGQVQLSAGLRMQPARTAFPVTGWRETFDAVGATIHLPFGYRLLAAPGADSADGSWVSQWSLLDIFLVAVLVLFAWHALGRGAALVALGYLLVAYQEPGRPLLTLGLVLALALLQRALPAGRLQTFGKWARWATLVLVVLIGLPFLAAQLRMALYPQLEPSTSAGYATGGVTRGFGYEGAADAAADAGAAMPQATMAEPPPPPAAPAPAEEANVELESVEVTGSRVRRENSESNSPVVMLDKASAMNAMANQARKADMLERYSKNTIVQTGRGLPTWQHGHAYRLTWSGPVSPDQDVRLLVSPPWLTRLLRVLAVFALAWLVLRLAGAAVPPLGNWRRPAPASLLPAALALLLLPGSVFAAEAVSPSDSVLAELKTRLARPPECAPDCAAIPAARVAADGTRLTVELDVHADARTSVALPMDAKSLGLESLRVDGAEGGGVRREGGWHLLAIERGVHRVQLEYRISGDRVALAFPQPPKLIEFNGTGWQAGGITEGRLLTETLSLSRVREAQAGTGSAGPAQEFPPYVRVERTLTLGLDWTVHTTVIRVAPAEGGFSVTLPLLPGEKVLTAGLRVREGSIEVPIPDGAGAVAWDSALDKADTITIEAPGLADRAEVWHVLASPLWRARFSGVPESVPPQDQGNDWHEFTFHPLPGEKLVVAVDKPAAVEGATQAVLDVSLRTDLGQRASETTLAFRIRASQGGERVITLPAGAELLSVQRNGEAVSLRLEQGKLSLAVSPGEQQYVVRFRETTKVALHNVTPRVSLGLPAANIQLGLGLPENRWILFTHGPRVGPAVLYWGELAVLLLVAWGLSRLRWTPLRLHEWLLLGLGFSTFSWLALAVVVAWLFAMAWRERNPQAIRSKWIFDAVQLLLVALTLSALMWLTTIRYGLLGQPNMHIVDPQGGAATLNWFADQSANVLPTAGVLSVPIGLYRLAMLAWALWLAIVLVRWMKWALRAWMTGGYWRRLRDAPAPRPEPVPEPPTQTEPPAAT